MFIVLWFKRYMGCVWFRRFSTSWGFAVCATVVLESGGLPKGCGGFRFLGLIRIMTFTFAVFGTGILLTNWGTSSSRHIFTGIGLSLLGILKHLRSGYCFVCLPAFLSYSVGLFLGCLVGLVG